MKQFPLDFEFFQDTSLDDLLSVHGLRMARQRNSARAFQEASGAATGKFVTVKMDCNTPRWLALFFSGRIRQ
ncbi:unnamed protein product [Ilex paraguariensis]|uniref:Uncharacterized protein n=1 Tax=Ilex paraguariensis TaxID=185542 RepID=A0ABC8S1T2_9AQUA